MAEQNEEWDPNKVQRFQEQRRCMGCKKRCQGEMITCEKCLEFQYCTIYCLEAHREEHRPICGFIGVKKGRLHMHVGKDKDRLVDIRQRARSLDDEGNMKTLENMFQSQSLGPDSNLPGRGENKPKGDNSGNTGVKKKKRSKKKNEKKRGNGSNNSNKNNSNNKNSNNNSKSQSSVQSQIASGQFGGPGRCNEEVKSGVKFGDGWWKAAPNKASTNSGNSSSNSGTHTEARFREGWWKQEPKNSGASASTPGAKSEAKDHESGSRTKPKFSDMYADSDDEEPTTTRRGRSSDGGNGTTKASRPSPSSSSALAYASADVTSGASAAESASGLEVVSYDAEAAEEQVKRYQAEGGNSSKLGKCDFCDTSGFVLTCGRCKEATYCDKSCQKQHFPDHKEACKRIEKFKKALAKTKMTRGLLAMFGSRTAGRVSPSLTDLADPIEYMLIGATHAIMLEIVGPHPHLFRHGAFLRDIRGQVTQILFYDHRNFYTDISSGMLGMLTPIPLSECLRPGNFILLLDSHWHHFLDGTVGIRIDDIDTVQFIFMDN